MNIRLSTSLFALAAALAACGSPRITTPPPVAVTIVVDYGEDRPALNAQTLVPAGASPIEALADVAEVDRRYVSRTAGDVWSVNGVSTDVEASMFWDWRLNGRRPDSAPDRYTLQNGDKVTWYLVNERPAYR